jgi:hypothetical protein
VTFLRKVRRYWPGLVLLAAALELVLHFYFAHRWPRFDDYRLLEQATLAARGEPLVVAPRWAEPLVRRGLGDDRLTLAAVAPPDVDAFAHALEVSVEGEHAEELVGWREVDRQQLGPFLLRRTCRRSTTSWPSWGHRCR